MSQTALIIYLWTKLLSSSGGEYSEAVNV